MALGLTRRDVGQLPGAGLLANDLPNTASVFNAAADIAPPARNPADLADLSGLAEEMFRRCTPPDPDPDPDSGGGFGDRSLRLDIHFRGAGKLAGDLTAECARARLTEALGILWVHAAEAAGSNEVAFRLVRR